MGTAQAGRQADWQVGQAGRQRCGTPPEHHSHICTATLTSTANIAPPAKQSSGPQNRAAPDIVRNNLFLAQAAGRQHQRRHEPRAVLAQLAEEEAGLAVLQGSGYQLQSEQTEQGGPNRAVQGRQKGRHEGDAHRKCGSLCSLQGLTPTAPTLPRPPPYHAMPPTAHTLPPPTCRDFAMSACAVSTRIL